MAIYRFQVNKGEVVEKLQQVELNSNTAVRNSIAGNRNSTTDSNQLLVRLFFIFIFLLNLGSFCDFFSFSSFMNQNLIF